MAATCVLFSSTTWVVVVVVMSRAQRHFFQHWCDPVYPGGGLRIQFHAIFIGMGADNLSAQPFEGHFPVKARCFYGGLHPLTPDYAAPGLPSRASGETFVAAAVALPASQRSQPGSGSSLKTRRRPWLQSVRNWRK